MLPYMMAFGIIGAHIIKRFQTGESPEGVAWWDNWGRIGTLTLSFAPVFSLMAVAVYFGIETTPPSWWLEVCVAFGLLPWALSVAMILKSGGYSERQMRLLDLPRSERARVTALGQDLEVVEMENGIEYDGKYAPDGDSDE